jgi:hypothetical protein
VEFGQLGDTCRCRTTWCFTCLTDFRRRKTLNLEGDAALLGEDGYLKSFVMDQHDEAVIVVEATLMRRNAFVSLPHRFPDIRSLPVRTSRVFLYVVCWFPILFRAEGWMIR